MAELHVDWFFAGDAKGEFDQANVKIVPIVNTDRLLGKALLAQQVADSHAPSEVVTSEPSSVLLGDPHYLIADRCQFLAQHADDAGAGRRRKAECRGKVAGAALVAILGLE